MPITRRTVSPKPIASPERPAGQTILREFQGNELFVAIVGPAGAGAGTAANLLRDFFEQADYSAVVIKASREIKTAAKNAGLAVPDDARKSVNSIQLMQDRGDDLRRGEAFGREEDHSAVARLVLNRIAAERADRQGKEHLPGLELGPDGTRRAYIIDSLRHPAEVNLLRRVYQDAFTLIGIVCDPHIREKRIRENLFDRSKWGNEQTKKQVQEFIQRDEDAPQSYGQHVAATFHEADFFVDNTEAGNEDLSITGMNDPLKRFVSLVTHQRIIRPTLAETAMHQARSAQMRSACLSRQVGAALVDKSGNIVATGTNEVPRAGGGVYGKDFDINSLFDQRCAYRETAFCSSNREQNDIIDELIKAFPALLHGKTHEQAVREIRKTRIGGLIEFSRAVHAEMDAILSAATAGVSPKGCRLYVTTYPCHYCARHIVTAGIDEVQFIEPYPKSRATDLHSDAITVQSTGWAPPSSLPERAIKAQVLFRPFVGVAPRMYRRVFLKDRGYKDKMTGDLLVSAPPWGGPLDSYKVSYIRLENEIGINAADGTPNAKIGA